MYVYIRSEAGLWTVGHYDPAGKWVPESDHDSPAKAAARVHHLNGGDAGAVARFKILLALLREMFPVSQRGAQALTLATESDEALMRCMLTAGELRRLFHLLDSNDTATDIAE